MGAIIITLVTKLHSDTSILSRLDIPDRKFINAGTHLVQLFYSNLHLCSASEMVKLLASHTAFILLSNSHSSSFPVVPIYLHHVHFSIPIVIVFILLAVLSGIPIVGRIYAKLLLYIDGFIGMIASSDTAWKQPTDWSTAGLAKEGSKRIIFIRHGESVWNEVFNNGVAKMPGNFVPRYLQELKLYPTPYTVFLDTPLNELGLQQAKDLAQFLSDSTPASISDPALRDIIGCLRGDTPEDSLICSSQLRRSLATTAISLKQRLEKTNEKILIHSACQEMSRNIDCMATSEPGCIPAMDGPDCGNAAEYMTKANQDSYKADEIFNPALNGGHKPLNERGLDRILNFADWIFTRPEHTIIVGGHSLWFRNFFKAFLPLTSQNPAKTCKMQNGSCVAFTLNVGKSATGAPAHWIESSSIVKVYKDFVLPGGSKKKD